MFLQIFATSPALLQLLPHDHCSAVVAEDCRVMSHHHHLTFSPLFLVFGNIIFCFQYNLHFLYLCHFKSSTSFYRPQIMRWSWLWRQDLGGLVNCWIDLVMCLFSLGFYYIFLSKGEVNQPLQLPLFALELVLVVAGCCIVHVDPAGFLMSLAYENKFKFFYQTWRTCDMFITILWPDRSNIAHGV